MVQWRKGVEVGPHVIAGRIDAGRRRLGLGQLDVALRGWPGGHVEVSSHLREVDGGNALGAGKPFEVDGERRAERSGTGASLESLEQMVGSLRRRSSLRAGQG